ncbi:MAG: twitching motility protein PilT [Actinobacteria bacterium]|nr:twitching motility protein PilT [Actinomycetota bacterium]
MDGVTYDTGALIAADRNDRHMWALHAGFLALEVSPTVPTPVLAEAWRGGPRQASLARFLALCTTDALTEEQAKAVGALATRADHDDIVDVTVVEGAVRRHDAVVTSNPTHIRKIADAIRVRLTIETV